MTALPNKSQRRRRPFAGAVAVATAMGMSAMLFVAMPAAAESAPSKVSGKLDSHLQALVGARSTGNTDVVPAVNDFLQTDGPSRVMVDVYLKSAYSDSASFAAALAALRDAGLDVVATHNTGQLPVAEGWIDVGRVHDVARIDSTRSVIAVSKPGIDTGGTLSEGDASHNGVAARALGANGAGVAVGVISDSINQVGGGVAGSQATGDLPATVTVLLDDPGASDEGRAMAEIIFDTAPGISKILFASGTTAGPVAKASSIDNLVANGANIIADDIFYLSEPMFQDGVVAQAVDNARAAGVTYFASAGNRARQSWEGTYADTGGFQNFGAGDTVQTVATVPNGSFLLIALQWNEAWGSASTDIDALLVQSDGTALGCGAVSGGIDDNFVTTLPSETVFFSNTCGASVTVGLKIQRYAGAGSPFMKYIARGNFGAFAVAEYNTSSNTINPDAAAATGSIAVAAVNWNEAGLNDPESFSSRGKLTRRRDKSGVPLVTPQVRQKPQIAAADGVATSVPGFAAFYGTSAAVPSAAGVAALVKSSQPTVTPAQIEAILTNPANTINCTAANNPDGSDDDCGFGFVLADKAVAQAQAMKASVSGTVRNVMGPMQNAIVGISPAASLSVMATAATAADGSFTFPNLPPGEYKIAAVDAAEVVFGAPNHFISQWYNNAGTGLGGFTTATPMTLGAATATSLSPTSLTYNNPGSVSGTVRSSSGPLANMIVGISPVGTMSFPLTAVTNASGDYTISGVPAGQFKVAVIDFAEILGSPSFYSSQWYNNAGTGAAGFGTANPVNVLPGTTTNLSTVTLVHN